MESTTIIEAKVKYIERNRYNQEQIRFHMDCSFEGIRRNSRGDYVVASVDSFNYSIGDEKFFREFSLKHLLSFFSYGDIYYGIFLKKKSGLDISPLQYLFHGAKMTFKRIKSESYDGGVYYSTIIVNVKPEENVENKFLSFISKYFRKNGLIEINETHLCVIMKVENSDEIQLDYVLLDRTCSHDIDILASLAENPQNNLSDMEKFVESSSMLSKAVDMNTRYCHELGKAYGCHFDKKYEEEPFCFEDMDSLKCTYCEQVKLRLKAFDFRNSIERCKTDKSIIAYSHRETGFFTQEHQISKNIKATIKTNFGYGSVTYFRIMLQYKDLLLSPYSMYLQYKKYGVVEVLNYWRLYDRNSYEDYNDSWVDAFEEIVAAHNLAITDESKFLQVYVEDECYKMIDQLERIVNGTENIEYRDCKFQEDNDRHLTIEKAAKTSSALSLISHILEFEDICMLYDCKKRIEDCNMKILPQIKEELKSIDKDIAKVEKKREILQERVTGYEAQIEKYINEKWPKLKIDVKNNLLFLEEAERIKEQLRIEFAKDEVNKEYQESLRGLRECVSYLNNLKRFQREAIDSINRIYSYFGNK